MPFRAQPIVLDEQTRAVLEARVRAGTTAQRDVTRAQIVLLAADGVSSRQISKRVGMHESHVAMWRQRFLASGLDGLRDASRPGGPPKYDALDWLRIVAKAISTRPADDPEPTWTYQFLSDALAEDVGISRSQLWRILHRLDVKPHKVVGWLNRPEDPEFWPRIQDVCGLYLNPPDLALVLSVDEKTGIQAKERLAPTQPAEAGRAVRHEFEYRRHGTASLLAALEVHSGKITARDIQRNDSVTFIGFLEELDRAVPAELAVHLILDNGSSHTSKTTTGWLKEHPRFTAHYTPKHASWVNQVELFFSILTRRVLKGGTFASRHDLVAKIMRFITSYNETSKPFRWTYGSEPLKAASRTRARLPRDSTSAVESMAKWATGGSSGGGAVWRVGLIR